MIKNRYLVVWIVISSIVVASGGEVALDHRGDISVQSMRVMDTIFVGGNNGGSQEYTSDGEYIRRYNLKYGGHNNVIDVLKIDDQVIMVSEYGYIEFSNASSGELLHRIQYNESIVNVESIGDGTVIIGTSMRLMHLINLTTYEVIKTYDMWTIDYASDVSENRCVNCAIVDLEFDNGLLSVIYGWNAYQIDVYEGEVKFQYKLTGSTPVEIELDGNQTIVYYKDKNHFDMYENGISKKINTPDKIVAADIRNGHIIVSHGKEVGIWSGSGWKYFRSANYVAEVKLEQEHAILALLDNEEVIKIVDLHEFRSRPLLTEGEIRIILFSLILLVLILLLRKYNENIREIIELKKQGIMASRRGFTNITEYREAKSRGFSDKKIMELVKYQGYDTYESYMRALMTKPMADDEEGFANEFVHEGLEEKDKQTTIKLNKTIVELYNRRKNVIKYLFLGIIAITGISTVYIFSQGIFLILLVVLISQMIIFGIIKFYQNKMRSLYNPAKILLVGIGIAMLIGSVINHSPGKLLFETKQPLDDMVITESGMVYYEQGSKELKLYKNGEALIKRYNESIEALVSNYYGVHVLTVAGYLEEIYTKQQWDINHSEVIAIEITGDDIIVSSKEGKLLFINRRNVTDRVEVEKLPLNAASYCGNCQIVSLQAYEHYIYALSDGSIIYKINEYTKQIEQYYGIGQFGYTPKVMEINMQGQAAIAFSGGMIGIYNLSDGNRLTDRKVISEKITAIEWSDTGKLAVATIEGRLLEYEEEAGKLKINKDMRYEMPNQYVVSMIYVSDGIVASLKNGEVYDVMNWEIDYRWGIIYGTLGVEILAVVMIIQTNRMKRGNVFKCQ